MVLISIAFAARKIAGAFEHPAIGRSQPSEIDFVLLDLPRERAAGEVGEAFFAPRNGSPEFHIETIGDFQSDRFHGNTLCITLTLPCQVSIALESIRDALVGHRQVSLRAPYLRLGFCAANNLVWSVKHGDLATIES
jgi:hypothetical protein